MADCVPGRATKCKAVQGYKGNPSYTAYVDGTQGHDQYLGGQGNNNIQCKCDTCVWQGTMIFRNQFD